MAIDTKEYYWCGSFVTIWGEVKDKPDMVIVSLGDGELDVVARKDLTPKEKSWSFIKAQERADELRLITQKAEENLDKIVDKVVDKALITLSSRIKFNALLGDSGNVVWASLVIKELQDLVKEKAPEVVKDKKAIF